MPFSERISALGPAMTVSSGASAGLRDRAACAGVAVAATAHADAHSATSALRHAPGQSDEQTERMTPARTADLPEGCAAHPWLTEI
jgi:hypothetical protein